MEATNFNFEFYFNILIFFVTRSLPILCITGVAISAYLKRKKLTIVFMVINLALLLYYWYQSNPYNFVLNF